MPKSWDYWDNKEEERMRVVTINLPIKYLQYIEKLIEWGITPSRSEYIRLATYKSIKEDNLFKERVNDVNTSERTGVDVIRIPNGDGTYDIRELLRRLE